MLRGIPRNISSKYCSRFGRIAVEIGFITEAQMVDALRSQGSEEVHAHGLRLLATILFDKGWMTSEQIDQVLNTLLKQVRLDEAGQDDTRPFQTFDQT